MNGDIQKQLEKLEEKKNQLQNQISNVKQRLQQAERQNDTRRKILVGAFFLEKYKDKFPELVKQIDPFLSRLQDRALFGLTVSNKS
jgi:predicted  nucleic acid-binding Zn-ribbon protein